MEIKTKEFKVFQFDELDEKAKEFAYDQWYEGQEFPWSSEYRDTLKAFCDMFGITVRDWNVDTWTYNFQISSIHLDDELPEGKTMRERVRIGKYILALYRAKLGDKFGDCYFTGFCADCNILDPFAKLAKWKYIPLGYEDFFRTCLDDFFNAWSKDMEYSFSRECFEETAREYEYLGNGSVYI